MSTISTIQSSDIIGNSRTDINTNFSNLNADKMEKSANLSDVANAATARTNLGAAAASHTHDDRYYTESETDTLLAGKASSSHTHAAGDIASGTIATARLGSGTANSSTYLRGDQTWGIPGGAWEHLGTTTRGTAGTTLTSPTFTPKKNLMILFHGFGLTVGSTIGMTFNGDTGANYAQRYTSNGTTGNNQNINNIELSDVSSTKDAYGKITVGNETAYPKIGRSDVTRCANSSATAPELHENNFVWNNTSAQITSVTITATNNWAAGSRITVLGRD